MHGLLSVTSSDLLELYNNFSIVAKSYSRFATYADKEQVRSFKLNSISNIDKFIINTEIPNGNLIIEDIEKGNNSFSENIDTDGYFTDCYRFYFGNAVQIQLYITNRSNCVEYHKCINNDDIFTDDMSSSINIVNVNAFMPQLQGDRNSYNDRDIENLVATILQNILIIAINCEPRKLNMDQFIEFKNIFCYNIGRIFAQCQLSCVDHNINHYKNLSEDMKQNPVQCEIARIVDSLVDMMYTTDPVLHDTQKANIIFREGVQRLCLIMKRETYKKLNK